MRETYAIHTGYTYDSDVNYEERATGRRKGPRRKAWYPRLPLMNVMTPGNLNFFKHNCVRIVRA